MKAGKREASFCKDGSSYFMRLKRTGTTLPQPARIVILKWYWEHVGGIQGWETTCIYDRTFEDWEYAHAVFNEILKRSDEVTGKWEELY
ncbi:hypothetical protein [Bacillus phage SDFMU_Pbc]|uniref:Uncharacterized protein n=1 Tax=Bacillus phage SDFMU_Pbc TaxID=3076135 RepID=A0AA96KRZ6_9CAUD|nr:hypothetical protein [Bacillus phage SDFMU_Pbc]